jgi:hypothetical protein
VSARVAAPSLREDDSAAVNCIAALDADDHADGCAYLGDLDLGEAYSEDDGGCDTGVRISPSVWAVAGAAPIMADRFNTIQAMLVRTEREYFMTMPPAQS